MLIIITFFFEGEESTLSESLEKVTVVKKNFTYFPLILSFTEKYLCVRFYVRPE